MKIALLVFIILVPPQLLFSQKQDTKSIYAGNELYKKNDYVAAEKWYQTAITKVPTDPTANFNLGNSIYQQKKYEDAAATFTKAAASTKDINTKQKSEYNAGNAYLENKNLDEAIASYKKALKLNPNDQNAKYNLSYALQKKKKKESKCNKPNDQEQNQQEKKEEQSKQEKNKEEQQNKGGDKKESQPQPKPQQINKEQAKQLLEVLKNKDEQTRKKINAAQERGSGKGKMDKDW